MKIYELEAKLNGLKSKRISLHGKDKGILLRWESKERLVKLVTDQTDISILNENLEEDIQGLTEVPDQLVKHIQPTSMISQSGVEILNILRENIRKVEKDPSYIPQAQEVNANVKSIIELAKAEVDYMKTLALLNRTV